MRVSFRHVLDDWLGNDLLLSSGALNTDWDQEGGAKERLKVSAESFRLEGLIVDGVRLGAV